MHLLQRTASAYARDSYVKSIEMHETLHKRLLSIESQVIRLICDMAVYSDGS